MEKLLIKYLIQELDKFIDLIKNLQSLFFIQEEEL